MSSNDTILIETDGNITRKRAPKELQVDVLATNVNIFLSQIEEILAKSPDEVGSFKFTEFTVKADVSAKGQLVLLGSGIEAGISGGLTFKFERKQ